MENKTAHEPSGVLIIDKHAGVTSHDIVGMVRRAYGTRRVGHTGTLDPLATGVLVVLVGRAAKASEYLVADKKRYLATLRLGLTTDTEDISGKTLSVSSAIPAPEEVIRVCESFAGVSMQIPPMYSAIKTGGKKLYEIARTGGVVEREARPIEIFNISCAPSNTSIDRTGELDAPNTADYTIDVICSSGTYIRTLCADIGAKLGCGGVMASLRRLEAGGFGLDGATAADNLTALSPAELEARLIPTERLFDSLPEITLPAFYERLCRAGCEIYQTKIKTALPNGILPENTRVRLMGEDGSFFALGQVGNYPDGSAVKAIKFFDVLQKKDTRLF